MSFWKLTKIITVLFLIFCGMSFAEPSVTIYNQNFAVVREQLGLDLKKGVNEVKFNEITMHLEPDSVVLRDPKDKRNLQILEQNYRADPISQGLLLSIYEGKEIEFLSYACGKEDERKIVKGKIIRSGYVPHQSAMQRYGYEYAQRQMAYAASPGMGQPVIEVDGKLRFSLPGEPLFPSLTDETILKPTLDWLIRTDQGGRLDAELNYITGGMSWKADYNMLAKEKGDELDMIGWVTMDNQTGRTFENARIKLMAGDVSKIQPEEEGYGLYERDYSVITGLAGIPPTVSEKAFEEYHLYTLSNPTTLRDRQTKQVEFVRANGIKSKTLYVYDGFRIDRRYRGWDPESLRRNRDYGTQCNTKVWVMREFENSVDNHLGIPLPRGLMRFYRRDDDGQLEFTGENIIDHTPKDEKIRVYTGNAFDLVGERKRTDFKINDSANWCDETFEIKIRNRKEQEAVEFRVVEHLYRWLSWDIVEKSHDFEKTDSQTIEFRVEVAPGEEKVITYKVHYTW
jgi:hypothetical protein